MNALRRNGPRALQQAEGACLRRSQRRLASESHHTPQAAHTNTGPTAEGLGKSFYMVLAAIPAAIVIYHYSREDSPTNPITSLINAYTTKQETWREMNALHTRMVEQAGADRNLFANSRGPIYTEMRFPETISRVSPYNVRAGWGSANLDQLVAHYRDKAFKEEEEKLQKMKKGKLPGQPNYEEPGR